jgi:hypothetical protein
VCWKLCSSCWSLYLLREEFLSAPIQSPLPGSPCRSFNKGKVLGCLVSTKGIEANPDKIKALVEMQDPVSVKDVQKLTGRVATLNRFIPRAAERSLQFFQVLRSAKNFQWSETQKQAFQELKDYLSNMTKLCPPETRSPL